MIHEPNALKQKTGGAHRAFQKDAEFEPAVITSVVPIDPQNPQLFANARPLSQTSDQVQTPIMLVPGFTRGLRVGMATALLYADGSPQAASLFGHTYNLDAPFSKYGDPMPSDGAGKLLHVNPDDMAIHHDETTAFMRWRNRNSTAATAAADGSPCEFEATFLSNLSIKVTEYIPPGSPPSPATNSSGQAIPPAPPTRALFSITMPQGASLVIDEPQDGESTFAYTHPTGASATCDTNGVWTFTSPSKILVKATDVELGDDDGKTLSFFDEINALTMWSKAHTHAGVATGSGMSGPPVTAPPVPVGTVNTHAV